MSPKVAANSNFSNSITSLQQQLTINRHRHHQHCSRRPIDDINHHQQLANPHRRSTSPATATYYFSSSPPSLSFIINSPLYAELAGLWPNGAMDNHGIRSAICKAKERERAIFNQQKEDIAVDEADGSENEEDGFYDDGKNADQTNDESYD